MRSQGFDADMARAARAGSRPRATIAGALLLVLAAVCGCAGHSFQPAAACSDGSNLWDCVTPAYTAPAVQPPREPSHAQVPPVGAAHAEYRRRFTALLAADRLGRLDRAGAAMAGSAEGFDAGGHAFHPDHRALSRAAGETADDGGSPPRLGEAAWKGEHVFQDRWRSSRQTLFVGGTSTAPRVFYFSGLQARNVEIVLETIEPGPAGLSGTCDGPVEIETGAGRVRHGAGSPFVLSLAEPDAPLLRPGPSLTRCALRVSFADRPPVAITALREESADPGLARLDSLFQVCGGPAESLPALQRLFHDSRWLSQTCPLELGTPRLLDDEREGFDAKVEALLGRPLPQRFYEQANPELPLDFSSAPRLSLIYLSYLDIKADFSGRVMERLVRHHAASGAKVRIMVTDILQREKEKAMLHGLAADHPNVALQEFRWTPPAGADAVEGISSLYKTHHVKMLAALSPQPGRSRAIIGGRNIHDGFLFPAPLDLSRFPYLQQYQRVGGLSLNYYANFSDFDLEFRDEDTVRALAAHLATLWHRDADTSMSRPFSIPAADAPAGAGNMRHFISVPYADGRALERYYVEMLDAAERSIEIVNPYLNLTPALSDALERALERGVRIAILARINLQGDLGGRVLTALNEMFVERFADRIEMYEYRVPDLLLHSKILMVDERLVVLSSVNLNNRSFIHDSENGIVALDRGFYRRMKEVFEGYRAQSVRLSAEVTVPLRYRLFFAVRSIREAF